MAVNFNDDTWLFVKSEIDKRVAGQTSVCTNGGKTFEELLQAQGAIAALKSLLNLPQVAKDLAATPSRQ